MSDLLPEEREPARYNYIGGASSSGVLGKNRYHSIRQVWMEKTRNLTRDLDNHHIRRGNAMEPDIEQYVIEHVDPSCNSKANVEKWDAYPLDGYQIFLEHPELSYVGGHPDGVGDEIIHEFKAPTSYTTEKIKKFGLNARYYYQVQHYMMCTGYEMAQVHVWDYDAWGVYTVDVPAEPAVQAKMIERYEEFWFHVQTGIEPQFEELELQQEIELIHDPEMADLIIAYEEAKNTRYRNRDLQKELKGKILSKVPQKTRCVNTPRASIKIAYDVKPYGHVRLTPNVYDEPMLEAEGA